MTKTFKEIVDAIPDEDRKVFWTEIDKRTTAAIKSFSVKHPPADETLIKLSGRLDGIEKAKAELESKFEIKTYALERCFEIGLPFATVSDLLPMFKTKEALDAKLTDLASLGLKHQLKEVNETLANNSYRPKSGNSGGSGSSDPLDVFRNRLSSDDLPEFERQIRVTRNQN
ncbi:MAG: hypothetical protein A2413_08535 [Treponema sp. RIFOXYC1_FULL_61_9]|nr:MAG: hypothetical protein A2001_11080 [Treponema sp. GWC1_61_84]OHE71804.1 MAG: hypothetical protein A2413_08535 [Treponema sp. RIFOXYC1_FULL_61_9]